LLFPFTSCSPSLMSENFVEIFSIFYDDVIWDQKSLFGWKSEWNWGLFGCYEITIYRLLLSSSHKSVTQHPNDSWRFLVLQHLKDDNWNELEYYLTFLQPSRNTFYIQKTNPHLIDFHASSYFSLSCLSFILWLQIKMIKRVCSVRKYIVIGIASYV
jgi:hypothetical protein